MIHVYIYTHSLWHSMMLSFRHVQIMSLQSNMRVWNSTRAYNRGGWRDVPNAAKPRVCHDLHIVFRITPLIFGASSNLRGKMWGSVQDLVMLTQVVSRDGINHDIIKQFEYPSLGFIICLSWVYHGLSWFIMVYHGLSLFHGTCIAFFPWNEQKCVWTPRTFALRSLRLGPFPTAASPHPAVRKELDGMKIDIFVQVEDWDNLQ